MGVSFVTAEMTMEARLQTDYPGQRAPDWPAAAVAGLAAGAILMVLDLVWSLAGPGGDPWTTSRMIAAVWTGPETLRSGAFSLGIVALALATHYVMGVVFALVLVAIVSSLRLDARAGTAIAAGAVASLVVYVFNFFVLVHVFPWFGDWRGWPTLVAHLVFGISTALVYLKLERRGAQPR